MPAYFSGGLAAGNRFSLFFPDFKIWKPMETYLWNSKVFKCKLILNFTALYTRPTGERPKI